MSQAILPLLQPTNSSEIQKSFGKTPEANDGKFSDMFEKAIHKQPGKVSQKKGAANDSMSKQSLGDASEKANAAAQAQGNNKTQADKAFKGPDSSFEPEETVSAVKFLKKLGLNETEIQKTLQKTGLNENATLLELLNNINFPIEDFNKFLDTSAENFLSLLGIEEGRVNEIVDRFALKTINENKNTINNKGSLINISLKDILKDVEGSSEKLAAVKAEDLTVERFFKKLGVNENEAKSLIKETGKDDLSAFYGNEVKAKDILKKMGLKSDEATKIIEKSIRNAGDSNNKIKDLILNKNFAALKELAEKPVINVPGKSDFQSLAQIANLNAASDNFPSNTQPEAIFSTKPVLENSPVSSIQTSGSMSEMNLGNGTNGYSNLANFTNEIPTDLRLSETTPKAFFERTVIDQVVSKVSFKVTGGQEEIKIHLDPPSLGSLHMKVSVDGKSVNTAIVADNSITKEIIQSNIQQLKNSMAEQGLQLNNISVSVGNGQSGDKDMNEFRMLARGNMDQDTNINTENNSTLIEQNSRIYYRNGYALSQSGVDLFI